MRKMASMTSKKTVKQKKSATIQKKKSTKAKPILKKRVVPGSKIKLPESLELREVFLECNADDFKFSTTAKMEETNEFISQDRAVRAIQMGLGIRKPGYNIYVAGAQGTGKTSVIKKYLETWSSDAKVPCDWVYVYNFGHTEVPRAISLTAGGGKKLKKGMETFVKALRSEIPSALQSEDYENAVNAYLSASADRKSKLFSELEKKAKALDFQIKSTRLGIETIPIVEGRVLSEKEYTKLSEQIRGVIEDRRAQIEPEVLDFARKVRTIENETKEYVERLRSELGKHVVASHLEPLIEEFKENKELVVYFEEVKAHVIEHLMEFVEQDEPHGAPPQGGSDADMMEFVPQRDRFVRYQVNVFVDNSSSKGAPVIIETNPTYYNLFGKIEKNVEQGMYLTDFTMIKAGALQRANGGYVVLNAMDIFKTGSIWDTLKRVLKNRLGFIEDMGEQYSLLPTSGLRPEPIPLDIKVILIGNDEIYHMLYGMDEDFSKIFKMKAHFDDKMPRTKGNITHYVDFVATRSEKEDLLAFDRSGVAAVVEYGSRLVADQRYLSTQFGALKDLTIEADFLAREQSSKVIKRAHVEEALEQKFYRVNLIEEQMEEMIKQEDVIIQLEGSSIGQVNGLAVYDMGDYSFGKVSRVTCSVSAAQEGIVNIERASKLSGRIHDKGSYILTSYIHATLAKESHLGVACSVAFEQSYGMIDGDSASVTELTAIVSALSRLPIYQNLAMTGSLDQFGNVQPIGGVNEKVEGFWRTAKLLKKDHLKQRVLIPIQNAPNLMLSKDARIAVKEGRLEIIAVKTFAEVFELSTGVALGIQSIYDERFEPGSALWIAKERIEGIKQSKRDQKKRGLAHRKVSEM
jgi:lon-related putative ATP-dependent protease